MCRRKRKKTQQSRSQRKQRRVSAVFCADITCAVIHSIKDLKFFSTKYVDAEAAVDAIALRRGVSGYQVAMRVWCTAKGGCSPRLTRGVCPLDVEFNVCNE